MNKEELAARLLATFAEELDDQVRQGNEHLLALEQAPDDQEQIRSLFRVMHTLKGAARAAGVPGVERVCHQLESRLSELRDRKRTVESDDVAALFAGLDEMSKVAASMRPRATDAPPSPGPVPLPTQEVRPVEGAAEGRAMPREATVRVAPERLDALLASSTRLLITTAGNADRGTAMLAVADLADSTSATARRIRREAVAEMNPRTAAGLTSIAESLDAIRAHALRLAVDVTSTAREVGVHARELSLGVRDLRLRPFSDAASALPRVVRDVALSTGKQARLEVEGESVQADRGVLDEIQNALLHVVRNAIDHGLESPEIRRQRGKPVMGLIRISASVIGDRISIAVADDGGGIDIPQVRRMLASRGEAVPGDDMGVAQRLFSGGITTRAAAGAISGRAVGLDAVRAAMERLRGSVAVRWVPGQGTTFTLEAPLSMSTVRAVLARVGVVSVALPTAYVVRMLRIPSGDVRSVNGRAAVLSASEAPIPLVSLSALLGPPLVVRAPTPDAPILAIHIRAGDLGLALRVDELIGEEELVVRPIRAQGRGPAPHVSGAALLATGVVALVLNVPQILASGAAAADVTLDGALVTPVSRRRRLLVADDSITTRTLESSVLEAAGYEVMTAVDGADAWRLLDEHGADLVVSDVEMPRMDGMQLCQAMRKSSRFKSTPVILITALETPEDRARGLESGADAYLAKSSFDQQGLLDTVFQLVG